MTARVLQLPTHAQACDQVANDLRREITVYRGLLMAAAEVLRETLPCVIQCRDALRDELIESTLSGTTGHIDLTRARLRANTRTRRRVLSMSKELADMASRQAGY